ncbi:hypothetical protein EGW08_022654 [Elysia chlorotica]|uniref:Phenylalanine--tRNA ligase alpha subunit n=1 Tax=Elysia chlorotica TaxID=188477 RepID=A0A3S1AQY2_ELYCH|nr:hypothetical protein EGW08_022654 [Elysia chlorotica]
MAELSETLLIELDQAGTVDSTQLAEKLGVNHQTVVGAIKSLQSLFNVIKVEEKQSKRWQLTDEGNSILQNGSHEAVLFQSIPQEGIPQAKLMASGPNAKVGFSKAMSAGWIAVDKKAEGGPKVIKKVESIEDVVQQCLEKISKLDLSGVTDAQKNEYKKRKLIVEVKEVSYSVSKGENFTTSVSKQQVDLTPEMISSGSWRTAQFKPFNFNTLGVPATTGHLHPLLKVREQFRQIFLEMGFSEMPTNNYVESSFWNFDALFQPQQHPARDEHDTFFMAEPATASAFPMDFLEKVKDVHSKGGYGSQGYRYDWKMEEAEKNILRTHTTAVSTRMLYKLAQEKEFRPVKYFSIDRVFRNENLDATHLAEFQQIEGVVADRGLTLGDLMGVINQFFQRLGMTKLRFKPAYNPYTEPSMEIFGYHDGLGKWVEIGNSGVFRPEMLRPMGLPEDVSVIAWGLSLERPTMIKYKVSNIRDLVGPKVNLKMVYENPLCRLEK